MRDLPSGTVTFLFTDIEGSTKLLHELGDAYADALAEHRRALRSAFAAHGGVEVDTQGDAFFVAFSDAEEALAAAREGQGSLGEGPIRVRIGLHTGEPVVTEEGYVGIEVHRAARIAAAAHGGQIVVSQSTRDRVPSDELLDLGEHRLKDFDESVAIFQLGDEPFPPLKTISNTNLPRPASSFVGREREVAEVRDRLRDGARLLTCTGPGGSGKTRLAIEASVELLPDFKAGVFWVGLAPLRDPALVPDTIARTLGARDGLAEHIGDREVLLLLDNLEQVVDAAPELAALVEACPSLRLLVTSRELLRVRGEVEYPVLPLAEPEAVELFCARAQTEPEEAVEDLCRALDNLPLALELAAARTSVLSPRQILERISQRLDLLTGGRDAVARQQTLRATIEWSYDLLSSKEQRLFSRLGVFAGGCTLEAAEQVADAQLDTLQSLVDKSLVRHTDERFWMLETIREFALELLEEAREPEEARRRHFEFYFGLAEAVDTSAEGNYGRNPALLLPERHNLRAALDGAVAAGEIARAVELMVMLENFWVTTNPLEGARRFEQLLSHDLPERLRARALRCFAGSTWLSGDFERSHRLNEESLALFRSLGDEEGVGVLLHRLGISTMYVGDRDEARRMLDESLRLLRQVGSVTGEAEVTGALAYLTEMEKGPAAAMGLFTRAADMAAKIGFTWWRIGMLTGLAECHLKLGRLDEAEAVAREELTLARAIGDRQSSLYGLVHLAWIAAERGDDGRAGWLWGAVEAEEERAPVGQWETERDLYVGRVVAGRGESFERARRKGRALSFEAAISEALES